MRRALFALTVMTGVTSAAQAHFQELIPSTDIIDNPAGAKLGLALTFTHPMEGGPVMEMAAPKRFGMMHAGKVVDLKPLLKSGKAGNGKTTHSAELNLDQPGDYVFFVEPQPYWEAAEGKYITHYTKVVVDVGEGEGWDTSVGLPVEIDPLVRPYGLWTNALFRGIVRHKGKPVPFAEIEVEWKNDGTFTAPSGPFVTQKIKADQTGQFAFAMPRAGWWGFAALVQEKSAVKSPDGKPAKAEFGGLMWVRVQDMK